MKKQTEIYENQEDRGGVKWYREKIGEMADKIDNEKFLKRIYISLSEYLKESDT